MGLHEGLDQEGLVEEAAHRDGGLVDDVAGPDAFRRALHQLRNEHFFAQDCCRDVAGTTGTDVRQRIDLLALEEPQLDQ